MSIRLLTGNYKIIGGMDRTAILLARRNRDVIAGGAAVRLKESGLAFKKAHIAVEGLWFKGGTPPPVFLWKSAEGIENGRVEFARTLQRVRK